MRILEIGAGTGGLASQVLPLLERGLHSYIFSDVSAAFFSGAAQKLAAFPEVEFKIFDLEKPGVEQELEAGAFDFIIGTNVLHAVSDVRAALRNLHGLLAPGGSLIFMDTATPQLWTETVFGLTSGWWRFTDRDLRPEQPLLKRAQWETVLRETGFAETTSLPGLIGPTGGEGQIGLLARKVGRGRLRYRSRPQSKRRRKNRGLFSPTPRDWVTRWFRGCAKLARRCRVVTAGRQFRVRWQRRFYAATGKRWRTGKSWSKPARTRSPERIVYLWNLDAPIDGADMATNLDALLHLTQALESARPASEAASRSGDAERPAGRQRPATRRRWRKRRHRIDARHFERTFQALLARHRSSLRNRPRQMRHLLWSELIAQRQRSARSPCEAKLAMSGDWIAAARPREQWLDPVLPLRLESRERGHLDTLRFAPFELPQCGPGQVLIEVKAAGMNFRDVLKALALYPGDAPDARIFGDEVGGIVRQLDPVSRTSRREIVCSVSPFSELPRTRIARARRRATDSGGPDISRRRQRCRSFS